MHHRNLAGKGIKTFKGNFQCVIYGVDDSFPLNLWERLIPQTEIQVNLMWQENATPKKYAYAYLNGPHGSNRMPLVPLGCAIQFHENTNRRESWAPHSVNGWYLGISTNHYHCYNI